MSRNWPEFVYPIADTALRLKSILRGSGYPLHRNESVRPFFIVGSGRCGTTLLRRILQASPQVHIPPETYMVGPAISFFRRNRDKQWNYLVRSVLSMFEFHKEFDRFSISLRPLVNKLTETPKMDRSLALILDSFYRYHGEQTGQTFERWGDKTPLYSYCLDAILAVFPDARFVHLIRDGVDVVQSMRKADLGYDLESAATRWKTAVSTVQAFARKHPALCYEARYESLVAEPDAVVSQLCSFLDVLFEKRMIDAVDQAATMGDVPRYRHHQEVTKPITTASMGKGRRDLSSDEKQRLHRIIGPDLERLGYDAVR